MKELPAKEDAFGGTTVSSSSLPHDPDQFRVLLQRSLKKWAVSGYKVVWLEIDISRARLIPIAAEEQFCFHHSGESYVMMIRRLIDNAFVPPYASHYIGAGGVVVNRKKEILVVREKRLGQTGSGSFKLPGGLLHVGEHVADGVVREVFEETGVETKFVSVACFRHQHGYRYGKSDIYMVCRLTPLAERITKQEEEIEECRWMPLDMYLSGEVASKFNKKIVLAATRSPGLNSTKIEGYGEPSKREVFMPPEICS